MHDVRTSRGGAFTLVELLVVVSIISLLLSLLVPALGRTKEITRRAVCGSNQHGIHSAVATYAAEKREWLPTINDWSAAKNVLSVSHWVRWYYVDGSGYWNFGNLYVSGHMTGGELLYCPSQRDVNFQYDSYSPWPKSTQPGPTAALGVRVGYGFNPYVKDPASNAKRIYQHSTSFPSSKVLIFDALESRSAIAHQPEPGWNILTGDGACRFVVEATIPVVEMADANFGGTPLTSFDSAIRKLELAK